MTVKKALDTWLNHLPHLHAERIDFTGNPIAKMAVVRDVGLCRRFKVNAHKIVSQCRLVTQPVEQGDAEMAPLQVRLDAENVEVKMCLRGAIARQDIKRSNSTSDSTSPTGPGKRRDEGQSMEYDR